MYFNFFLDSAHRALAMRMEIYILYAKGVVPL